MDWDELPRWRRVLLAPLALVVLPVGLAALLAILGLVAPWNAGVRLAYWAAGEDAPPKGAASPPQGDTNSA